MVVCGCNIKGTKNQKDECNLETGICDCNTAKGYTGKKCDECMSGYFKGDGDASGNMICNGKN